MARVQTNFPAARRGRLVLAACMLAFVLPVMPAVAQDAAGADGQSENVRIEYAQVLRAEPVYQTLRATSMVERCDASTPVETEEKTGIARVIGAVRGALTPDPKVEEVAPSAGGECRMVPMEREFRRPIAYDVDYVHKGVKYRSRLPADPGNRLRVRVSVTPVVSAETP
ncbi:MAG TPA: hypothetical protein PK743_00535 [Luteimonas sp.]|nr:hypothetical protein [Luteimonas sp.]HRO27314.1 hypothetical protein [Luteimonas sp.]HRP71111.1 hypothetical protein [Luteimonas sp.]